MKSVNSKRKREMAERNFGRRADAVHAMECIAVPALREWCGDGRPDIEDPPRACLGDIQACHDTARGMGGCNSSARELFPACFNHHPEFGAKGSSQREAAEARYHVDVTETAERIALELDEQETP